jgi:diguanylate cyclase (GGDEF)-like protein
VALRGRVDVRAKVDRIGRWNAVAWLLLTGGIGLSAAGAAAWRTEARAQAEQSFRAEAASVGSTVTTALRRMDDLTTGARTLIAGDPYLTNAELARWYRSIGAKQRYPGALGFGYVELVPASQLARYAAIVRADPVPGFARPTLPLRVTPSGRRPSYCLIRLGVSGGLARLVPGGAGYDLCAVTGSLLASPASGRVNVLSASLPPIGQILIVSAPVYQGGGTPRTVSARKARMLGWVTGVFNVGSVLGGAIVAERDLSVSIARADTSATPTAAAARAKGAGPGRLTSVARIGRPPSGAALTRSFVLEADGRWIVTVSGPPRWGWLSPTGQGIAIFTGGVLVSLLLFLLVQVLAQSRARALRVVAEKTDELRYQALHDALTGLPNRALIIDRTGQLIARARRERAQAVAMFLDLDDFKTVNDTFGHAVGDELLRAVAARISGALREPDTVGRLGGDEFVILIEGEVGTARPALVAERLLEVLREPFQLDVLKKGSLSLTASIGIAIGDRIDGEELLRDADIALYEAKGAGKHRYAIFREEMHATVHARLALEIDLHEALERGELFLDYQPTFDLADEKVTGVEALLRWRHPTRGVVEPSEFIPIAESTGLIVPIGRWVLETACAQVQAWHEQGHALDLSVNVSALQLDDPDFPGTIAEVLAASDLDPSSLILEITETVLMRDPELVSTRLAGLKALGIRIAVDDFGTGYSSLAYLQQFPVDELKIDRSFVAKIATSSESRALIRTLVQLGKTLNLGTLAEGIEDRLQLEELRQEDCELGQGFLFARPLDPEAMLSFLERRSRSRRPAAAAP